MEKRCWLIFDNFLFSSKDHFQPPNQNCEKRLLASSCQSACPHGITRFLMDGFSWNFIFEYFFENLSRNFKFLYNLSRITGTLYEDQYTFFIISCHILLRMKNVAEKVVEKIKTRSLCSVPSFFPRKSWRLGDIAAKCDGAGQATDDNVPFILESNPHPFYSFRLLKNQMLIRIACGLDSRSRVGFWKNDRAAVCAVRTIQ